MTFLHSSFVNGSAPRSSLTGDAQDSPVAAPHHACWTDPSGRRKTPRSHSYWQDPCCTQRFLGSRHQENAILNLSCCDRLDRQQQTDLGWCPAEIKAFTKPGCSISCYSERIESIPNTQNLAPSLCS